MFMQVDLVSGDLVLNRGNLEWWSFHVINVSVCVSSLVYVDIVCDSVYLLWFMQK